MTAESLFIGTDDFARRFAARPGGLMWFLGAGASASAGIPTAWDMIWEFKQKLFISQRRISPKLVSDLSNPSVRSQLQAHIDSSSQLPKAGSPDEYASLFESVYPTEADRRAYLDAKLSGAKPSYGHLALATLMLAGRTRLVWTTNFDPLLADACAKVFDTTGALGTVALDAPDLADQLVRGERWPVEVKLHGDFRSRRLKNSGDELRSQDARLRNLLVKSSERFGLVAAGYSGRDGSIMQALNEALEAENPFPSGLFWLHRGEEDPLPAVINLIAAARSKGVEAALVRVENFDEATRDLLRLVDNLDTAALDSFTMERQRRSASPLPVGGRGWPIVRLNALEIKERPSVCRRVVCQIGGYAEVHGAIDSAAVEVIAARVKSGVLAFGSDGDIRAAFGDYGPLEFDLHTLEERRLRYESGERGLIRAALGRALSRNCDLHLVHRRSADLLFPKDPSDKRWAPLLTLANRLTGTVKGHPELAWSEGIGIRLDWADDRLWLLIEPRIVYSGIDQSNKAAAADFSRERVARRYNKHLNDFVHFWTDILAAGGSEMRALGVSDGVDGAFRLFTTTAYSRRAQP